MPVDLIVKKGDAALDLLPDRIKKNEDAMAETIENNIRKVIIDESAVNPKHYEEMSQLLNALIEQRRSKAIEYQEYLVRVKELAFKVTQPGGVGGARYPDSIDTVPKKSLYDNLGGDEVLVIKVDTAVR